MSGSTTSTSTSISTALAPTRTGRSYDAYPIRTPPREVAPGIMDDGTLSTTHPPVHQFLAYAARKSHLLETAARSHTRASAQTEAAAALARSLKRRKPSTKSKSKSKSKNQARSEEKAKAKVEAAVAHWHGQHKDPRVTRWRCMDGGFARVADVHAALGPGVSDCLAEAVFALAALSVFSFWAHPAHWAFWAVNVVEETAVAVHEVVRECFFAFVYLRGGQRGMCACPAGANPKVITVPDNVAWVDAKMAVRVLRVWHGGFIPPQPQPEEKEEASDEADDDADGEMKTKNANGKRTASDDGPSTPTKRKRTKETENVVPTRQSARIRKAAQVDPVAVETSVPPQEEEEEVVADEPEEEMAVDVQSAEPVAVEAESGAQVREAPVTPGAKKSRGRPSRPRKSAGGKKPKSPRKPRASCGDVPSEPSPPAKPSPSSAPCTIRIPPRSAPPSTAPVTALCELLDDILPPPPQAVSAPPASGETTAAASRESTAVGTPFSGMSTRVGTPLAELEVKLEAIVAKPKVVREIPTPVRTSARIRAKSMAGRR